MVLTDPEFESSVLISSDEGASYQKYRLTFYVLSLLFHPTVEDWALAYSHDQKVSLLLSHLFSVHVKASASLVKLPVIVLFLFLYNPKAEKHDAAACEPLGTL